MSAFSENVLIGLGTGLVSGLITGFYSALVTSKAIRFNSLKIEVLRCINTIEYMSDGNSIIVKHGDFDNLIYIIGELYHFGYKKAGQDVTAQNIAILDALIKVGNGQYSIAELEEKIDVARKAIRATSPGWQLLNPAGRI